MVLKQSLMLQFKIDMFSFLYEYNLNYIGEREREREREREEGVMYAIINLEVT